MCTYDDYLHMTTTTDVTRSQCRRCHSQMAADVVTPAVMMTRFGKHLQNNLSKHTVPAKPGCEQAEASMRLAAELTRWRGNLESSAVTCSKDSVTASMRKLVARTRR